MRCSECVVESEGEVLLELPVAVVGVPCGVVVEPWIEEKLARDVFVELECELVLPFELRALVGGESVHTCFPRYVVGEGPVEVDLEC